MEDIAKEMGEEPRVVTEALEAIMEPVSLYDPVYSEGGDSIYIMDQIRDEECNDEGWLENYCHIRSDEKAFRPRKIHYHHAIL